MSLTPAQCSVPAVTQLVTQQVGFEALLLDSKCYPLLANEGTSGIEFWKSTRKILGSSKSVYEKVSGSSANVNIEQAIDLTDDEAGPSRKRQCATLLEPDTTQFETRMQLVLDKLTRVENKLIFLEELTQAFQCVICKSTAKTPVVSPCCQRVVGCEVCVNTWLRTRPSCPLCSTGGTIRNKFALKGFEEALSIIQGVTLETEVASAPAVPPPPDSDSDSDFERPPGAQN